jgi:hypothetical protein
MMKVVTEDYTTTGASSKTTVIPNLTLVRCDKCGCELLDMEACRRIDEAHRILRNCPGFRPLRKSDGSYSKRCADCGWMEQDH